MTTRLQLALFSTALLAISFGTAHAQSADQAPDTMAARVGVIAVAGTAAAWLMILGSFAAAALTMLLPSSSAQAHRAPARLTLGILGTPGTANPAPALIDALDKLGYQEGRNLTVIFRAAKTSNAELAPLAAELIALKPDVIATFSTPPVIALKSVTPTIPIVMVGVGDPIATMSCAESWAPGGSYRQILVTAGAGLAQYDFRRKNNCPETSGAALPHEQSDCGTGRDPGE